MMQSTPLTHTAIGCITHRVDEHFSRMIESLPTSIATIIVIDAIEHHLSLSEWRKLCPTKEVIVIEHSGKIHSFAELRNTIVKKAREQNFQWVLFLDSDEVWGSTNEQLIQAVDKAETQSIDAIACLRSDVFYGKELRYGEAGRQSLARIIKTSRVTYRGATHETISDSTPTLQTTLKILHFSHESISQFIEANTRYAQRIGQDDSAKNISQTQTLVELAVLPWGKWLYNVVFRLGFLDGWHGVVYASCMSLHSLMVRMYRYEHHFNAQRHKIAAF